MLRRRVRSRLYLTPNLENYGNNTWRSVIADNSVSVRNIGKNSSGRDDRKTVAPIEFCDRPGPHLMHRVPFDFEYIGINSHQEASYRLRMTCLLEVSVDGERATLLSGVAEAPRVLQRGLFAPQCWFRRHRKISADGFRRAPRPSVVSICAGRKQSRRPVMSAGAVYV